MESKKKSYSFAIGIAGAVLLLLQAILSAFDVKIDVPYLSEVAAGICSLLVMFGIITGNKSAKAEDLTVKEYAVDPADKPDNTAGEEALSVIDEGSDLIDVLEKIK